MKRLAGVPPEQRAIEIEPFIGKVCRVTFRRSGHAGYDSVITGRIVGASYHATNGTSTGDLIVACQNPKNQWVIGRAQGSRSSSPAQYTCQSIALVNVGDIEVLA